MAEDRLNIGKIKTDIVSSQITSDKSKKKVKKEEEISSIHQTGMVDEHSAGENIQEGLTIQTSQGDSIENLEQKILEDIDAMAFPEEAQAIIQDMKIKNKGVAAQKATQDWFNKNGSLSYDFNISLKPQQIGEAKINDVDDNTLIETMREKLSPEKFQEFYIKNFIKVFEIDFSTADGQKIAERLNALPKEVFAKMQNPQAIKDLLADNELEMNFDNLSTILELSNHITLRTPEEIKETENKRETIINQLRAQDIMTKLFLMEASFNDQYTDSIGLFGQFAEGIFYLENKTIGEAGLNGEHYQWAEKIKKGLNYVIGGQKNHYQWAEYRKECAQRAADLKTLNPEKFKEGFKDILGEYSEKYGISYNQEAFKKLFEIIDAKKAQKPDGSFTDEYKNAIRKAINIELYNPNADTMNTVMNGLGETILMLMTLGWSAETKGGQVLAQTAMGTFNRLGVAIASKQVNNQLLKGALRLTGKGVSLIGPMLNEGTKMYTYSAVTGTVANINDTVIKGDYENFLAHQMAVMQGANSSFAFGAFAGFFGSAVPQKVTQFV
ncbi:MAG: hypothetical protein MJ180_06535, partial [Candidatus Gastranaerophilales bacterium]|nr:hypothetical protein [Candidatus Gastranaerophilales bacterium]